MSHIPGPAISPDSFENTNDIRLLDKCLNLGPRYKLPEHLREKMITKLASLIESPHEKSQLKAIQTLVKLDQVNVEIFKAVKPKRVEQTITNVTKLSDAELTEALKAVQKLLPSVPGGIIDA